MALNHRQRKHAHMHSTIFNEQGPEAKSVYGHGREEELYQSLKGSLKEYNQSPPEISIPSAVDMRCTQMAGHQGVVLPSGGPGGEPQQQQQTPRMSRTTDRNTLVHDGESKAVVHANARDQAIPQEFWQTSVNLQWHDVRNERCRQQQSDRQDMQAQEMRLREMSSEIFGKERLMQASTACPRQELLPESLDLLHVDSQFQRSPCRGNAPGPDMESSPVDHRARVQNNLRTSAVSTLASDSGAPPAPLAAWQDMACEDPANSQRRRQEKNFSDLFDTRMGERKAVRGQREEILGSNNCSYLDPRSEIAARNKGHWRQDEKVTAADRWQSQTSSSLFDQRSYERPVEDSQAAQIGSLERACWECSDSMQISSEIARRRVAKDHLRDFIDSKGQTHLGRKQDLLASNQVRYNLGASGSAAPYATAPAPSTAPPMSSPGAAERRSAKDTKLASLQSSIFG